MQRTVAVMSSDGVNRQGSMFPVEELTRQVERLHARGIPSLLAHDAHQPIGWTSPRAVFFRRGTSLLLGDVCYPETAAEHGQLVDAYRIEVTRRMAELGAEHFPRLVELLQDHLSGDERRIYNEGAALVAPDLARRVFPSLFDAGDKHGLVPLARLDPITPGVFRAGELCLFAHPFFRRGLSRLNSLNEELLTELHALVEMEEIRGPSILLDPDMVGLAETVRSRVELQYWWGPRFSDDLTSIAGGVTRHEATDRQRLFSGIGATDFAWQVQDGKHTLEVEELLDTESHAAGGEPPYGCRCVHSIVNHASGVIEHLDGAIRGYSDEAMLERIEVSIERAGRRSAYTKLWRIDGAVALSTWKNLIHHHYRDNRLVGEYFAGVDDVEPCERDDAFDPVPYAAWSGLGVLFALRHHDGNALPGQRVLEPGFSIDGEPACSVRIVDLDKVLRRRVGESMLDSEARPAFVGRSDMYVDLPLVMHASVEALDTTRIALLDLLGAWESRDGVEPMVALNLGLRTEAVDSLLGVVGPVGDVARWLGLDDWFPATEDLGAWSTRAAQRCREEGTGSVHPFHVVAPSFRAQFQRVAVDRSFVRDVAVRDGNLTVTCEFPAEQDDLATAFGNRDLHIRPTYIIRQATCSQCGGSYLDCPHVKLLDEGVSMVVTAPELVELHWTDRPA